MSNFRGTVIGGTVEFAAQSQNGDLRSSAACMYSCRYFGGYDFAIRLAWPAKTCCVIVSCRPYLVIMRDLLRKEAHTVDAKMQIILPEEA